MILGRIVRKIREAWPRVGIIIRGDSHYLEEKAKEFYLEKGQPVKLFTEFEYQAGSWTFPQRVICKVEYNDKGSNIRFILTNLVNSGIRMIYDTIYCGRGSMELMIKEHKNHLRSDKTSCHSFKANQFRLFLHSIAYALLHAFREKCLKNTQFAKAQYG